MAPTGEVKVVTGRSFANVAINGEIRTIADVVKFIGEDPASCTIRVNNELCLNAASMDAEPGMLISAFRTAEVANSGVKGQRKS